jgi:hypothetical protein
MRLRFTRVTPTYSDFTCGAYYHGESYQYEHRISRVEDDNPYLVQEEQPVGVDVLQASSNPTS